MGRVCKSLFGVLLCIVMIVTSQPCRGTKVEAATNGLKNPRVEYVTRDIVEFGQYWQEDTNNDGVCNEADEMQPIRWQVLYVDSNGNALLLSEKILDFDKFNNGTAMCNWENSELRANLNSVFLWSAFTYEEAENIYTDTIGDKVFLLSISDVTDPDYLFNTNDRYSDQARIAQMTGYAARKCTTALYMDNTYSWFLRSNGTYNNRYDEHYVQLVSADGGLNSVTPTYYGSGIRPALRVNLSSKGIKKVSKSNVAIEKVTWDSVILGQYNGQNITWRVLSVEGDKALLLSDLVLANRPYSKQSKVVYWESVSWESSDIRNWLNGENVGDFYKEAFSEKEKQAIKTVSISNKGNNYYRTADGNDTSDKVFLLSLEDAINSDYGFPSMCNSESSVRKIYDANLKELYSSVDIWWLRSSGSEADYVAYVNCYSVHPEGCSANKEGGVRPALYIDLNTSGWKKGNEIVSGEKPVIQEIQEENEDAISDNEQEPVTEEETLRQKVIGLYKKEITKILSVDEDSFGVFWVYDFDSDDIPECMLQTYGIEGEKDLFYVFSWNGKKLVSSTLKNVIHYSDFLHVKKGYLCVPTYEWEDNTTTSETVYYKYNKKKHTFSQAAAIIDKSKYVTKNGETIKEQEKTVYKIGKKKVKISKFNKWLKKKKLLDKNFNELQGYFVSADDTSDLLLYLK